MAKSFKHGNGKESARRLKTREQLTAELARDVPDVSDGELAFMAEDAANASAQPPVGVGRPNTAYVRLARTNQAEKVAARYDVFMDARKLAPGTPVRVKRMRDGVLQILDADAVEADRAYQVTLPAPNLSLSVHNHTNTANGGTLPASAIATGQIALARGGTGSNLNSTGPGDLTQVSSGAAVTVLKHNRTATTNPGAGDDSGDGYAAGSIWINTTADTAYICTDAGSGAAVWVEVGGSGGSGMTDFDIDGDDGDGPHTVTDGSTFTLTGRAGIGVTMNGAAAEFNIDKAYISSFTSTDPNDHLMYFADSDDVLWTMQMKDLPYTPATSGDWLTPPTTIAAALDELAARIYAIENP